MFTRNHVALACLVAVGLLAGSARPAAPEDPSEAALRRELTEALGVARKAAKGEKAAVDRLAASLRGLTKTAERARSEAAGGVSKAKPHEGFATQWNDAVTVLRWHGAPVPPYILVTATTFQDAGLVLGYPLGTRWTHEYSGDNDQLLMTFTQKAVSGAALCQVKIWTYRWNVVYSGVGGENYVKLARELLELERAALAGPKAKASARVTVTALNAQFPRAQFYFVEGFDPEEDARVRRLNYYIKDNQRTYNVEFIVRLDGESGEEALAAWQRTDADPERAAMLKAIASVEDLKSK